MTPSTSTPCSRSALAAVASLPGSRKLPVNTTRVSALGFTERAPSSKALTLARKKLMGSATTYPSLFVFVVLPAAIPIR